MRPLSRTINVINLNIFYTPDKCKVIAIINRSFQEKYQEYVHELLNERSQEAYYDRLVQAFNELTPPSLPLNIDRRNRIQFMNNFDKFVINVRGFLCVK